MKTTATQRALGVDLALAKTEPRVVRVSDTRGNAGAVFWDEVEKKWVVVEYFTENTRFVDEAAVVIVRLARGTWEEDDLLRDMNEAALLRDLDNQLWVVDAQDLDGLGDNVEVLWRG